MAKTVVKGLLFLFFGIQCVCKGFDFTLDFPESVSSSSFKSHQSCGVLRCTETLTHTSAEQSKSDRKLTGLTIYRKQLSRAEIGTGRWKHLASVTSQHSKLDQVSDGARIFGQFTEYQANLTLNLVKAQDCQFSQFSCVATFVDSQGQRSVKKSLVGRDVELATGTSQQSEDAKDYVWSRDGYSNDERPASVGSLTQLVNSFHLKLDWIKSRLDDSLKNLENRLEDKVGDLRATVTHIIGGFDNNLGNKIGDVESKIDSLENRLEDKLGYLDTRLTEVSLQTKSIVTATESTNSQLTNKIDNMGGCMAEASKQHKNLMEIRHYISDQLGGVISVIQSLGNNLTSLNDQVHKIQLDENQSMVAATRESSELFTLVSNVASLSDLTQRVMTSVETFRNSYAGGSLVPVEEFSDPLGIGKKEWRLVFRGTAYNNVPVYPAYIHGTGIPREVEQGCKQFNQSLPCVNHYRNKDALADWDNIDEVLFAVYKDGQMVKHVVFNGKGSSYTSWFHAGRVILSSWDDLTTQPHNFFSIKGFDTLAGHVRRFYINRDHTGGCSGFRGWFYARDLVTGGCSVDEAVALPVFQYASGNTVAVWTSANVARAEAIGIFVKYD